MTAFLQIQEHEFAVPANEPPPIDFEQPPADVDACEHCDGLGVIVTHYEVETGLPVDEPCTWCDGSGDRRGWAA